MDTFGRRLESMESEAQVKTASNRSCLTVCCALHVSDDPRVKLHYLSRENNYFFAEQHEVSFRHLDIKVALCFIE